MQKGLPRGLRRENSNASRTGADSWMFLCLVAGTACKSVSAMTRTASAAGSLQADEGPACTGMPVLGSDEWRGALLRMQPPSSARYLLQASTWG